MIAFPASAYDQPPEPRPRIHMVPDMASGTLGMALFVVTEAMLFVMLFFAYVFLSHGDLRWPSQEAPRLRYALPMLAVLITSSGVLHWGELRSRAGQHSTARGALAVTVLLGIVFLALQSIEFREHWKTLTPTSNAYGSIFYTITSVHGVHVLLGAWMLLYVATQPRLARHAEKWQASYRNTSIYWHFVDVVWVCIVFILYLIPHFR